MEQITLDLFSFEELSAEAKQVAINTTRDCEYYLLDDWYQDIKDDFHHILSLIGFHSVESQFTGFCSQGDGASFSARYGYQRDCVANVKIHAPQDTKLHEIVSGTVRIMRRYFYRLECEVYASGHYCHSNTMRFNWSRNDGFDCIIGHEDENTLEQLFKDLANWYYERLENSYNYYMSDEVVIEDIKANDHKYYACGKEF